ncbi:hypothetical protein Micbo1qcDRAFT_178338 [Microdochium bolleyi]|uniref:Uncharacterized protein n=1 Tax=Microdochium bolleyi TaxID=196109 RepID=A0A136ITH4_9PEZI|nr:hypothetical protein Micbo1qcDRAFT_178338 [Microdochium bolleyi]
MSEKEVYHGLPAKPDSPDQRRQTIVTSCVDLCAFAEEKQCRLYISSSCGPARSIVAMLRLVIFVSRSTALGSSSLHISAVLVGANRSVRSSASAQLHISARSPVHENTAGGSPESDRKILAMAFETWGGPAAPVMRSLKEFSIMTRRRLVIVSSSSQ